MRFGHTIDQSPLFAGVEPRTVSSIADALTVEAHGKGTQIAGPADSVESFRVILEGRVKVVRSNSRDGHELTLWLLGPGDGFDVVGLLDGEPHAVTSWAVDDVRVLAGPVTLWQEHLQQSPALRLAAYRYVGSKLHELSELAGDLALHDTSARLAHLLLHHFTAKTGNLLRDLPQRELASLVGSVRIVVSRLLAQMKRQGIVELHGGMVRSVDLDRLLAQVERQIEPEHSRRRAARRA